MIDIFSLTSNKLVEKLKEGEISSVEVCTQYIGRIKNFEKDVKAWAYFNKKELVLINVDKQAYLSALAMAKYIVVTCDSTSMISEAATTGKPIYVAQMSANKSNERFKIFFNLFESLNIIKELNKTIENWTYKKLNETNKIAEQLKDKIKMHDFS